ncbi:light-harvesting complex-like protein OHP1 [Chloropicon roscoffensis]|uniref:Light-harvesting complex-like protein OHP1 n=1 Tax=Chloropicon roscoffensis TaxID=1461544 RepID=A0AAX4PIV2_9CHLO
MQASREVQVRKGKASVAGRSAHACASLSRGARTLALESRRPGGLAGPARRGRGVAVRAQDEEGLDIVGMVTTWIDEQIENNPRRLLDEDVQSKVAPPAGVSLPSNQPNLPKLSAGFTYKAERWNSRASMVGFFSLLFVELVTRKGLLELMGLQVGNGLGFEF